MLRNEPNPTRENAMPLISMLRALAVATTAFALAALAGAQTFPSKPIRLISPYAAGGANDIVCRVIAEKLSEVTAARSGCCAAGAKRIALARWSRS